MRKLSMVAAILLLSSAWVLAQSGTSPSSDQNPSSTSPSQTSPSSTSPSSQQPAQQPETKPDTSAQSSSGNASTIEGCVGGSAGNYTLTDASGKTYQLSGDTSKLADHVGHQVRITGDEGAGAPGAASSGATSGAAGGSSTITVKKVKMISSSCPSK